MKRLFISLAILVALTGTAAAEKSLRTARIAAGVGTGVSSVLFISAFFIGEKNGDVNMPMLYTGLGSGVITPSLGEFYAGKYVTIGMGLRVAAGLIAAYGVTHYDQEVRCNNTVEYQTCKNLGQSAYLFVGLAGIIFVGGAAYDIQELPDVIDDANGKPSIAFAPTLLPTASGDSAFGFAAMGRF
jgi:hypothetical protein